MVLRASAQLVELGTYDLYYMDIDGNGRITASDARTLLRYSAKLCELPTSDKVPTAKITYQRPAEDKEKLADLRLLMAAYQAAQNEKERQALEEAYYNKYFNNETTTAAETTTTTTDTEPVTPDGDLNGDGSLSVADAVLLFRFVNEQDVPETRALTNAQISSGDLDGDGILTILDIAAFLAKLLR